MIDSKYNVNNQNDSNKPKMHAHDANKKTNQTRAIASNMIEHKFLQHGKQLSKNGNTEDELMRWLLAILMMSMEKAVREISALMHDSFQRFKQNEALFLKTVNAATNLTKN